MKATLIRALVLTLGSGFIVLFSSCSNVDFSEKPIAKCNGSDMSCQSATYNGRKSNNYNLDFVIPTPKTDILFVVDNSRSMAPEQRRLGGAFNNFASALNGVDWQVGITTTDITSRGMGGQLVTLQGVAPATKILTNQIANYQAVFNSTISNQGESGSDDERGIRAALGVLESGGFVRPKSHVAVVVLSDEDEGSNGQSLSSNETPRYYVDRVNALFKGQSHSFYGIIIRPGDVGPGSCYEQQISPLHGYEGHNYFEIQKIIGQELYGKALTPFSPEVGSVCDSNYNTMIERIGDSIRSRIEPIVLPCDPIEKRVEITPASEFRLFGRQIIFTVAPKPTDTFKITFSCYADS